MEVSGRFALVPNAAMMRSGLGCRADTIRAISIALTAVMKIAQTRWSSVMSVENITTMAARLGPIYVLIAFTRKYQEMISSPLKVGPSRAMGSRT
jgi:hypothetical protein